MFEISSISDALEASIDLKHPVTGALLGASITLAGPEHPLRKAIDFNKQRTLRASIQKAGKLVLSDPADDELDSIEKLATITLGWSGITDAGAPLEFSKAAAQKLYSDEKLGWLRAQLLAAAEERERFIKA